MQIVVPELLLMPIGGAIHLAGSIQPTHWRDNNDA